MLFFLVALACMVAALIHGALARKSLNHSIELLLVYPLAGSHGLGMLGVAVFVLVAGEQAAEMLGVPPGNEFQMIAGDALMAIASASILCIWLRGAYLVGPLVAWTVYFYSALFKHLGDIYRNGASLNDYLHVILTHTLLPTVMLGLAVWLWRRRHPRLTQAKHV